MELGEAASQGKTGCALSPAVASGMARPEEGKGFGGALFASEGKTSVPRALLADPDPRVAGKTLLINSILP